MKRNQIILRVAVALAIAFGVETQASALSEVSDFLQGGGFEKCEKFFSNNN